MKRSIEKCLIIGSGPAGYSAAIYAARADLKPILFTGSNPGGQLTTTTDVDNYPGYPLGVLGPNMMEDFKSQAMRFETKIIEKTIAKVIFSSKSYEPHKLYDQDGNLFESYGVIIATGASTKYLGLKSEAKFLGKGVSSCATCDGFFYKGKQVAVIGGGDTALEEAIYLSRLCKKVYLIVRKNHLKASKAMQHRILSLSNVEILFFHELKEVIGGDYVEAIEIENNQDKKKKTISLEGVFIAIGHMPNTDLFKNQIDLDKQGYILTKKRSTHTNKAGIFASGDVQDPIYRQAITSAASGVMAALDLERYLIDLM